MVLGVVVWALMRPVHDRGGAQLPSAEMQMASLKEALDAFQQDNGYYPRGTNGLLELVRPSSEATNWHGPYLEDIPLNPWGREYIYQSPGKYNPDSYDLILLGPSKMTNDE